jgi:hypothetical protein
VLSSELGFVVLLISSVTLEMVALLHPTIVANIVVFILILYYINMSLILGVHPRVQPVDSAFIIKEVRSFFEFISYVIFHHSH